MVLHLSHGCSFPQLTYTCNKVGIGVYIHTKRNCYTVTVDRQSQVLGYETPVQQFWQSQSGIGDTGV